jgi:hypothetical protein
MAAIFTPAALPTHGCSVLIGSDSSPCPDGLTDKTLSKFSAISFCSSRVKPSVSTIFPIFFVLANCQQSVRLATTRLIYAPFGFAVCYLCSLDMALCDFAAVLFCAFCILQCVRPLGIYPHLNGWWQLTDMIPDICGLLVLSISRLSCLRYDDSDDGGSVAWWRARSCYANRKASGLKLVVGSRIYWRCLSGR